MIDTHAHIYSNEFVDDIEEVVSRAISSGVTKILMPNIDLQSIEPMLNIESQFPGICISMMGLHPCDVKEDYKETLTKIEEWIRKRDFIAVGEIGTDRYWDTSFWDQQKEAFRIQCRWALELNKPVVIHCRESIEETIDMVSEYQEEGLRGVFHCFTGTALQAERITELGFYLGLGGVSTFKNAGMSKVIPYLNKSKIVLETDAPYLAPVPHRGKRNEPAYVSLVAKKVAELFDISLGELDELTTHNAENLFFQP